MPRHARLVLPEMPLHIIQRGNNRSPCFYAEEDRAVFLGLLERHARSAHCHVHAYVLMTNHVHLLISPHSVEGPGKLMKSLGQTYVHYVNRRYARVGTLWSSRFRSCLIEDETYLLTCQRYIELNPVRAGMVAHPAHHKWSSYRRHAHGSSDPWLTPHALYAALGTDAQSRQAAYRELFLEQLPQSSIDRLRLATKGNYVVGSTQFATRVAEHCGHAVLPQRLSRA